MYSRVKPGAAVRRNSPKGDNPDTLVEKQLQNDNNQSISVLAQNISSIKSLSKNITTALKDEEELMGDLESGFGKSDNMMGNTMNKLNKLMDSNSGNVL